MRMLNATMEVYREDIECNDGVDGSTCAQVAIICCRPASYGKVSFRIGAESVVLHTPYLFARQPLCFTMCFTANSFSWKASTSQRNSMSSCSCAKHRCGVYLGLEYARSAPRKPKHQTDGARRGKKADLNRAGIGSCLAIEGQISCARPDTNPAPM